MLKLIGMLVVLAVNSSKATFEFDVVDLGLILPKKSECPANCAEQTIKAANFFIEYGKEHLQEVLLPHTLSSCECKLHGVEIFDAQFYCTEESEAVDYIHKWTHPRMNATCSCELPNNPVEVAEILSKQNRPAATCGKPPYPVNSAKYMEFTCTGSGEGKSNITLNFEIKNFVLGGVARIDIDTSQFYPFHMKGEIDSARLTYDDNPNFHDSFQCLKDHIDAVTSRLITAFTGWFYPCTFGTKNVFIHNQVVEMLNCDHKLNR